MISQLIQKIQKTKAPICVGLDPMLGYIPNHIVQRAFKDFGETMEGAAEAVWQFNKGIIDNTYCGDNDEWMLSVVALRDTFIPKGTKIAQFRFIKSMTEHDGTPSIKFRTVETLENESRGGFGTTGQ